MTAVIPAGTLVIVPGRKLGRVVRTTCLGPAPGYSVEGVPETRLEGTAPHFAPDWCVKPAVIGETVCRMARGQCYCGHVHVRATELAWLSERTA